MRLILWLPAAPALALLLNLSQLAACQPVRARAEVQVQAGLRIIDGTNPEPTVFLSPRVRESQDSVIILARQRLMDLGIGDYQAWEIPDDTMALLDLRGVSERSGGFATMASLAFFSHRATARDGLIRWYRNTYLFRVKWEQGTWSFEDTTEPVEHADGRLRLECADTYFAPPEEKPEVCRGRETPWWESWGGHCSLNCS